MEVNDAIQPCRYVSCSCSCYCYCSRYCYCRLSIMQDLEGVWSNEGSVPGHVVRRWHLVGAMMMTTRKMGSEAKATLSDMRPKEVEKEEGERRKLPTGYYYYYYWTLLLPCHAKATTGGICRIDRRVEHKREKIASRVRLRLYEVALVSSVNRTMMMLVMMMTGTMMRALLA